MINVDRYTIALPEVLTGEKSLGEIETEKSIKVFGLIKDLKLKAIKESMPTQNLKRAIENLKSQNGFKKFEAYSHEEVKWSLHQLFHGKCSYCETKYDDTQPMDVEHFRPKGAITVKGKKIIHEGYYWLAATWENLLPSCIDCNRQRTQISGLTNSNAVTGKANEFEILDEGRRANNPGEEVNEHYLLLNPCNLMINPEEELEFKEDGMVIPQNGSKYGIVSIPVYGLNRMPLLLKRKEKISKINQIKFIIRLIIERNSKKPNHSTEEFVLDLIHEKMIELAKMCSPKEEYTALSRQLIMPFIESIFSGKLEQK